MGKRAGKRRHGDVRLRIVHGGAPQPKRGTTVPGDALQPLIVELRRRMRDSDPWSLLAFLSTVVDVADVQPSSEDQAAGVAALVESFIGVDLAETTAALTTLAVLVQDPQVVDDIDQELAHRRQPMPLWLRGLRELRVSKAHLMSADDHLGANVVLGIEWSGGQGASFLVYVDHALGTVVRDAFPTPVPIEVVLGQLDDADTGEAQPTFDELDLADARRLVEEALEDSDEEVWDPESDTWPAGRPILGWLLGTMPEDGEGWAQLDGGRDHHDLDDLGALADDDESALDELVETLLGTRRELVDQFASSTAATLAGVDLTRDKDRAALALIVGTAGPMPDDEFLHWTTDRLGDLLFGILPRTLLVDEHIARRIPQLLKAFAVWCLGQTDAADRDIVAVRDAVDEFGPDYVGLVTSFEALRLREAVKDYARVLGDPVGIVPVLETTEAFDWTEFALDRAAGEVGGRDALMALDAEPLPDEDFDWSVVPADIREPVTETIGLLDALATERFDLEFRTACRRFLATVVSGDPDIFRRRGSTASAAAVVAWLVGRANGIVARGGDGISAGELWAHFGIKGASSRGQTIRRAAGLDPYAVGDSLGHPEWLTSPTRRHLVRRRDDAQAEKARLR